MPIAAGGPAWAMVASMDVQEHLRRKAEGTQYICDDWLWLKTYHVKAGDMIAQHLHEFDHFTVVATGTVRLWIDDQDQGEISTPKPIHVKALHRHKMLAVTDALIFCIHNLRGKGEPGVLED